MRQVPKSFDESFKFQYGVIGNGRMAQHLVAYLNGLGLSHWHWREPRNLSPEFFEQLPSASHVLILVSDKAISKIADVLPPVFNQRRVHFSAATKVEGVDCVHPLMTFGPELYTLDEYQKIQFTVFTTQDLAAQNLDTKHEEGQATLSSVLPGLPNHMIQIAQGRAQDKMALYHALCVVSGNFAALLWKDVLSLWSSELQQDPAALEFFLQKTLQNTLKYPDAPTTGPIARGDLQTLAAHHAQLGLLTGATAERLQALHTQFSQLYGPARDVAAFDGAKERANSGSTKRGTPLDASVLATLAGTPSSEPPSPKAHPKNEEYLQ